MTVWVSVTDFKPTSPDELILVPDFESAGEASEATKKSVDDGTMTTAAMYETGPVCEAVDLSAPTDNGAAAEVGDLCIASMVL